MMKLNWEDILIVGGSICQHRDSLDHWPKLLCCLLTGDLNDTRDAPGIGYPGASWWSTKRYLDAALTQHKPKVLIVTHAESGRIPHDDHLPLNGAIAMFKQLNLIDKRIYNAAEQYYRYLYSEDFHLWAQHRWFDELDNITKDIPLTIHILQNSDQWTFKNGITIDQALEDLSTRPFWDNECRNHLTPDENTRLAHELYKLIENFSTNGRIKIGWEK